MLCVAIVALHCIGFIGRFCRCAGHKGQRAGPVHDQGVCVDDLRVLLGGICLSHEASLSGEGQRAAAVDGFFIVSVRNQSVFPSQFNGKRLIGQNDGYDAVIPGYCKVSTAQGKNIGSLVIAPALSRGRLIGIDPSHIQQKDNKHVL